LQQHSEADGLTFFDSCTIRVLGGRVDTSIENEIKTNRDTKASKAQSKSGRVR
jgi:hypothetical protein